MNKIVICLIFTLSYTFFIKSAALIPPRITSTANHYSSKAFRKILGQNSTEGLTQLGRITNNAKNFFLKFPTDEEIKFLRFKHGLTSHYEKYEHLKPIHDYWEQRMAEYHFAHQLKYARDPKLLNALAKKSQVQNKKIDPETKKLLQLKKQYHKAYYQWIQSENKVSQLITEHRLLQAEKKLELHTVRIPSPQMSSRY